MLVILDDSAVMDEAVALINELTHPAGRHAGAGCSDPVLNVQGGSGVVEGKGP
jgi:hypothetical protein